MLTDKEYEDVIQYLLSNPETSKIGNLVKSLFQSRKAFQEALKKLQETVDYVRVCIKYQTFDLEATRRENQKLLDIIKKHNLEDELRK